MADNKRDEERYRKDKGGYYYDTSGSKKQRERDREQGRTNRDAPYPRPHLNDEEPSPAKTFTSSVSSKQNGVSEDRDPLPIPPGVLHPLSHLTPEIGSPAYQSLQERNLDVGWMHRADQVQSFSSPVSSSTPAQGSVVPKRGTSSNLKEYPFLQPAEPVRSHSEAVANYFLHPIAGNNLPKEWQMDPSLNYRIPVIPGTVIVTKTAPLLVTNGIAHPGYVLPFFGVYYVIQKPLEHLHPFAVRSEVPDFKKDCFVFDPRLSEVVAYLDKLRTLADPNDASAPRLDSKP